MINTEDVLVPWLERIERKLDAAASKEDLREHADGDETRFAELKASQDKTNATQEKINDKIGNLTWKLAALVGLLTGAGVLTAKMAGSLFGVG